MSSSSFVPSPDVENTLILSGSPKRRRSFLNAHALSSFNVSENPNFPPVIWHSKISLISSGLTLRNFSISYDARVLLRSSGQSISTVHVASSSSIHVINDAHDGKDALHLNASFAMDEETIGHNHQDEIGVDLSIEANSMERRKVGVGSYMEVTSFVMIGCKDMRIEFGGKVRMGKLLSGGETCRVQRCATKLDALFGNKTKCRVIS